MGPAHLCWRSPYALCTSVLSDLRMPSKVESVLCFFVLMYTPEAPMRQNRVCPSPLTRHLWGGSARLHTGRLLHTSMLLCSDEPCPSSSSHRTKGRHLRAPLSLQVIYRFCRQISCESSRNRTIKGAATMQKKLCSSLKYKFVCFRGQSSPPPRPPKIAVSER